MWQEAVIVPFLKFKCESCGKVFDELVKLSDVEALRCPDCGGKVRRAYEGKCLGAKSEGCFGNCSCCSGCFCGASASSRSVMRRGLMVFQKSRSGRCSSPRSKSTWSQVRFTSSLPCTPICQLIHRAMPAAELSSF